MAVVRKSEFAKLCNVTKGLVSQWIAKGYISGNAIVGEGRSALIDPELACAQLRERLAGAALVRCTGALRGLSDRRPELDAALGTVVNHTSGRKEPS